VIKTAFKLYCTDFRTAVENKTKVRNLIDPPEKFKPLPDVKDGKLGEIPSLKDLGLTDEHVADPRSAFPFPGGESAAIERLNNYFWKTDHVSKYKETRNGMIGEVKFFNFEEFSQIADIGLSNIPFMDLNLKQYHDLTWFIIRITKCKLFIVNFYTLTGLFHQI
jgi:hypothetical protein